MVKSQRRACPALPGLLCSVAIDATAARVAFGKGEVFLPRPAQARHKWRDRLDMSRVHFDHPEFGQFNGLRRGHVELLGYWGTRGPSKIHVFAARCDCGRFVFRGIHAWLKGRDKADYCSVCALKASFLGKEVDPFLYSPKPPRRKNKCPRLRERLNAAGFSKAERHLIIDYRLPTDDLVWLRGAVDELASKGVRHG